MRGTKTTDIYKVLVFCWANGLAMCEYQNTQIISSCLKGYCQNKKYNSEQGQNAGLPTPTITDSIGQNKTCQSLDPVGNVNRDGWTPLHEAAYQGRLDVAKCLVGSGADVNANADSGIPLHLAAKKGHLELVKFLVEHGGRVDALDGRRYQPLQLAAWYGCTACVKYLLDKGAIIEHGDSWTSLHEAANYGFLEMVKLLVEKGGNVNTMTKDGTPVHLAARNGHLEVLKYLVENGGNVNMKDSLGYSPLQKAAWHGHKDTVKYLLDKGAQVESRTIHNYTALHEAASYGHLDIAKLLVEKGANVNAVSRDGTPLQMALRGNHSPVVELLKANGAS